MNINHLKSDISVVLGKCGTGKTLSVVMPSIKQAIMNGDSFVATDAKNQLLSFLSSDLKVNGYKTLVFNFRKSNKSDTWNPLEHPYSYYLKQDYDSCIAELDDFAQELFNLSDSKDDFWLASAKDLFVGLSLLLFEDAKKNEINFKSLYYMAIKADERFAGSNLLKEYIKLRHKGTFDKVSSNISVSVNSPADTRGGIMSVFIQRLRLFERYSIFSNTIDNSTFKVSELFNKKTAVFFQFEDEKTSSNKIVTVMIKMIFNMIIKYQTNNNKSKGNFRFFLDDLLSLGHFDSIEKYYLCSKNRGVSVQFVINDTHLFKKIYDEEILKSLLATSDKIMCPLSFKDGFLDEFLDKVEYFDKEIIYNDIVNDFYYETANSSDKDDIPVFEFDKKVVEKYKNDLYMSIESDDRRTLKQEPVDIEEMLKKIDRKIEELENEEKQMSGKDGFFDKFKRK